MSFRSLICCLNVVSSLAVKLMACGSYPHIEQYFSSRCILFSFLTARWPYWYNRGEQGESHEPFAHHHCTPPGRESTQVFGPAAARPGGPGLPELPRRPDAGPVGLRPPGGGGAAADGRGRGQGRAAARRQLAL